jgi:hypothetical protein
MSKITGTIDATEIDPMLAAIRQSLVDATDDWAAEFTAKQVVVISPDDTDEGITAKINKAVAMKGGLCLLIIAGDGKNPDKTASGPLCVMELEMQLYVSSRVRGKDARSALALVSALARFYHHAQITVPSGVDWYEKLYFTGFTALPDPDYTAYAISFEREMEL